MDPKSSTAPLRSLLARLDDVALTGFCMDHFPLVYDKFGDGMRRDAKINLLLEYCMRNEELGVLQSKLMLYGSGIPQYAVIPRLPEPHYAHSYALQANFTGRSQERKMLLDWLSQDEYRTLVLVAIGGMGKSSLSWYWLQHDVDQSQFDGVLWWSFYEREGSFSAFIAEALRYASDGGIDPSTLDSDYDRVRALVRLLRQLRILIVLDGFERELRAYGQTLVGGSEGSDEPGEARRCTSENASRFLRDVAAGPTKAKILVTTRLMLRDLEDSVGIPLDGCRSVDLGAMQPSDVLVFLQAQGVTDLASDDVDRLCEVYGGHPLSLRLLSGLIVRNRRDLGRVPDALFEGVQTNFEALRHRVLDAAYEALPVRIRGLLSRLAAFRHPVTYDMVAALESSRIVPAPQGWLATLLTSPRRVLGFAGDVLYNPAKLDSDLAELVERGLLSWNSATRTYDLHPVVRGYAYDRLRTPENVHQVLRHYYETVPYNGSDVGRIDDLNPVIELFHHTVRAGYPAEAWRIYDERLRSPLYYHLGAYREDTYLLKEMAGPEEQNLALFDIRAHTWILIYLAMDYERIGELTESFRLANLAVSLNLASGIDVDYGSALVAAASSARNLGCLRDATELAEKATEFFDAIGDANWRGISHRIRAHLLMICGDFARAVHHLDLAEEAYTRGGADFRHGLSRIWFFRAEIETALGHIPEAKSAVERSLAFSRPQTGQPYVLEVIKALCCKGKLLLLTDDVSGARACFSEALVNACRMNILELRIDAMLGSAEVEQHANAQHPDTAVLEGIRRQTLDALTLADNCQHRLKQADALNSLARLEWGSGNYAEAARCARRAAERAWCDGEPFVYRSALAAANDMVEVTLKYSGSSDNDGT